MNQVALYETVKSASFTILVFEDHPQFFGNWRAHIKHGQVTYEVVNDNREGWLTLWCQDNGKGSRLFEVESSTLNQEQKLSLIQQWLEEVKKREHV